MAARARASVWMLLLGAAGWASSAAVAAASVYVIDQIQVGLHAERAADSAIVVLVPSGTALEVLERSGALLRVRTEDGREGWIDAEYASPMLPVAARLLAVSATNEALRAELGTLRNEVDRLQGDLLDSEEHRKKQISLLARKAELEVQTREAELAALRAGGTALEGDAAPDGAAATDLLGAELERLRGELARLRAELGRLQEGASSGAAPIPSTTLREMQRLAEENQKLKARLDAGQTPSAQVRMPSPARSSDAADAQPSLAATLAALQAHELALLGFTALLLLSLGALWQDHVVRRRHGGYRL